MKQRIALCTLIGAGMYGMLRLIVGEPRTMIMLVIGFVMAILWEVGKRWWRERRRLEREHTIRDLMRRAEEANAAQIAAHRQYLGRGLIQYIRAQDEGRNGHDR